MGTLWTFGCSFTGEYYPVDDNYIKSNYDLYKSWRGGTLPDVWPTLLGKKLNMKVENRGIGGDSNYGILTQFFNAVDLIKEGDVVVFGWTNVVRFQAANSDSSNGFNQILPTIIDYPDTGLSPKTIEEILINRSDSNWLTEVVNWIKFINLFMEKSKVNVYHWNSHYEIFNIHSDFIDSKRFMVLDESNEYQPREMLGYLSHTDWYNGQLKAKIIEETNGEIEDCHFGEYGHITQANVFYEHIMNNLQFDIK
jgi:hypothetical protein